METNNFISFILNLLKWWIKKGVSSFFTTKSKSLFANKSLELGIIKPYEEAILNGRKANFSVNGNISQKSTVDALVMINLAVTFLVDNLYN